MNQTSAASAESQHELLVGLGLTLLHHRAHALLEQGRVDPGKPQAAGEAKRGGGREIKPGRRPMQRSRRQQQQRAKAYNPQYIMQQQTLDHAVPSIGP